MEFKKGDIVTWGDEDYGAVCEIEKHPQGLSEHDKVWVWNNEWFYPQNLKLICRAENREDCDE